MSRNRSLRITILAACGVCALVLAACGVDVTSKLGSIAARAVGHWTCAVFDGAEAVDVADVVVESKGQFNITLKDGSTDKGEWDFDDGVLTIDFPARPSAYVYSGLDGDSGAIDVAERREPRSGKFDYDIESEDHVVFSQTEWFNGQPTGKDISPLRFDCRRGAKSASQPEAGSLTHAKLTKRLRSFCESIDESFGIPFTGYTPMESVQGGTFETAVGVSTCDYKLFVADPDDEPDVDLSLVVAPNPTDFLDLSECVEIGTSFGQFELTHSCDTVSNAGIDSRAIVLRGNDWTLAAQAQYSLGGGGQQLPTPPPVEVMVQVLKDRFFNAT